MTTICAKLKQSAKNNIQTLAGMPYKAIEWRVSYIDNDQKYKCEGGACSEIMVPRKNANFMDVAKDVCEELVLLSKEGDSVGFGNVGVYIYGISDEGGALLMNQPLSNWQCRCVECGYNALMKLDTTAYGLGHAFSLIIDTQDCSSGCLGSPLAAARDMFGYFMNDVLGANDAQC